MRRTVLAGVAGMVAALVMASSAQAGEWHRDDPLVKAFTQTTRSTSWQQVARIPLRFPTHHPQGFTLVGDKIFLSTVEVLEWPVKYPEPIDGYDRTPGKGVGHVLVLTRSGELLKDITLGEGIVYHPGGIDYDGKNVWVPVAEYRPNSNAIVYRLDPKTYRVTEAFRARDHVGGVVRDRATGAVHGVSWGSRTLYSWTSQGKRLTKVANEDHLLDYQDCGYVGYRKQLCSGITGMPDGKGGSYELGGLVLRDLRDGRILHQLPVPLFSTGGHVLTRNPVALELDSGKLRLFTAPDDGDAAAGTELYILEATL